MHFELTSGIAIDLIYLRQFPDLGDMIYLQSVRSGRMDENSDTAQSYRAMAGPRYSIQLADLVANGEADFDAIARAPSSREDGVPYHERVQERLQLKDLTDQFSKSEAIKSAEPDTSPDDVISGISYRATGDESAIRSLLIVDDSIATGSTISAMLHHLERAGLRDCKVTVAVPALLRGKSER